LPIAELPTNPDELLLRLVEADETTRPNRERFVLLRVMSGDPRLPVQHPGLPEESGAHEQDIEDLADRGYLRLTKRDKAWHFDITPEGFERARKLRLASESPRSGGGEGGLQWSTDVLPVLLGVGQAYSASAQPDLGVTPDDVAEALGQARDDELDRILYELTRSAYLEETLGADQSLVPIRMRPTEKGLQVTSGWPGGESQAAAALLAAIAARRDAAGSEEERSRLQRAYDALSGLGREVLSDVLANVLTGRF
jgi:hypothetical protein